MTEIGAIHIAIPRKNCARIVHTLLVLASIEALLHLAVIVHQSTSLVASKSVIMILIDSAQAMYLQIVEEASGIRIPLDGKLQTVQGSSKPRSGFFFSRKFRHPRVYDMMDLALSINSTEDMSVALLHQMYQELLSQCSPLAILAVFECGLCLADPEE